MAEEEEGPYDATSAAPPAPLLRKPSSSPSAPPAFAFDKNNSFSGLTPSPAPAATSSSPPRPSTAASTTPDKDEEPGALPSKATPSVLSANLNSRWQQYETQLENDTSLQPPTYSNYKGATNLGGRPEIAPRQPYSFRKSHSYDTDELIRKYGGLTGLSPSPSPLTVRPSEVREQAQRVLDLVDDSLKSPVDIRRTESGGFRVAPPMSLASTAPYAVQRTNSGVIVEGDETDPYMVRRTASGSLTSATATANTNTSTSQDNVMSSPTTPGGKRLPAALSGLNFERTKPAPTWNHSGRYTFSDPSFKNDDNMSDEDDIVSTERFQDEPLVDVVRLESRAAGTRAAPYSDEKKFDGDFEGGSKTWSSRYQDNPFTSQKHLLDQWDREFQQGQEERLSARNMFMSTANSLRSSASHAMHSAGSQKQKIFGSGGFSFRNNYVFGGHRNPATEKAELNLRTVWKDVDDDAPIVPGPPRVHKTWQEVMLNKRKRRRILAILVLVLLGIIVSSSLVKALQTSTSKVITSGVGETVTFYVTSDTPYNKAAEERLVKDLQNMALDAEFVIHLGNIQDAAVSLCPKSRYSGVASVLAKSPVPLYVVPGQDDWVNCPDQSKSFSHWMSEFESFDLQFSSAFEVKRDETAPEAFTFLHKGVLFMGLHIVSGAIADEEAWVQRQDAMLKFYFGMASQYEGYFRSIVVLGNARPSAQQITFFSALFSTLKGHSLPLAYIHANQSGDTVMLYNPFEEHPEVQTIGVQNGSLDAPLKISVGFGETPFVVG